MRARRPLKLLEALAARAPGPIEDATARDRAARDLTDKCGYAAAALTVLPLPGSEVVAVVPLHVGMVVAIGNLHGEAITRDSAHRLIARIGATVGLSLVGSRLATTAAKVLLPGLGGFLGAPFMYASTHAIGAVARVYFQSAGALSDRDLARIYKDRLRQARKEFDPRRARSPEARDLAQAAAAEPPAADAPSPTPSKPNPSQPDPSTPDLSTPDPSPPDFDDPDGPVARLERLRDLRDQGLLDAAEYDAAKQRILDAI